MNREEEKRGKKKKSQFLVHYLEKELWVEQKVDIN